MSVGAKLREQTRVIVEMHKFKATGNQTRAEGQELILRFLFLGVLFVTGIISLLSFLSKDNGAVGRNISQISADHIIIAAYFIIGILLALLVSSRWRFAFILLPALYFVFVLGLAFDLASATLHGLALYAMGLWVCRLFKCSPGPGGTFILGLFIYVPILGALSLFSLVTMWGLIVVDGFFILSALGLWFIERGQSDKKIAFKSWSVFTDILLVLFFIIVLRSSANLSHDPDWYSYGWMNNLSKPSLWAFDGYINAVHFYGKVQEASMGWLGFRVSPYAEIIFSSLFLISALEFLFRQFDVAKKSLESALILLLVAAPAVIGVATTGKADTLGISALLIGLTILTGGKTKSLYPVLLVCIFIFLTSKPTYFIWGGLICLLYVKDILNFNLIKSNVAALVALVVSVGILWARTYVNTGLIYVGISQLNSIQALLGLVPSSDLINIDFKTLVFNTSGFFEKATRQFFNPGDDVGYSATWIGLAGFVSMSLILYQWKAIRWFDAVRVIIILGFAIGLIGVLGRPNRILDGFYVLPAAFFLVIYFLSARQASGKINIEKARVYETVDVSLILMVSLIIYFSVFLSDWRRVFHRSDFFPPKVSEGYSEIRRGYFEFNKMEDVVFEIMKSGDNCKTLAIAGSRRAARIWNKLDCSVETNFSVTWQPPLSDEFMMTSQVTDQFYDFTGTRFTAVEKSARIYKSVADYMSLSSEQVVRYEDERWVLYERLMQ